MPTTTIRSRIRRAAILTTLVLALAQADPAPGLAQGLPYSSTPSYQPQAGDPYGMNYNWDYMRYGLPGVGVSPWNPIVQAQLNLGLKTARYNMYNAWTADMYQSANLYNQQAVAQAIQNQQALQAMEPRYDVRTRAPKVGGPAGGPAPAKLPRNKLIGEGGKVLWPEKTPDSGELGKSRAAAEAAIRIAVRDFEASGKATVASVVEAKDQLIAFGKPALLELSKKTDRATTQRLLDFLANLEGFLDTLVGG